MMVATFNGNPRPTITCYSPTNVSEETKLMSYPLLFVAARNTTSSSLAET